MTKEEQNIGELFNSCWQSFGEASAALYQAVALSQTREEDKKYEIKINYLLTELHSSFQALGQKMRNASVLLADAFK